MTYQMSNLGVEGRPTDCQSAFIFDARERRHNTWLRPQRRFLLL